MTLPWIGVTRTSGLMSRIASAAAIALLWPQSSRRNRTDACQIAVFDLVAIDDQDVADAEQRQVLQHLVADRPAPTTSTLAARSLLLVPPLDQPQARIAIGIVEEED